MTRDQLIEAMSGLPGDIELVTSAPDHSFRSIDQADLIEAIKHSIGDYSEAGDDESDDGGRPVNVFLIG
jgi:hypothetical protein